MQAATAERITVDPRILAITSDDNPDPVTDWARAVVEGLIVAGPYVRASAARHLRDLEEGPARGLFWDIEAAQRGIGWFRDVLFLNGGDYEGVPFDPLGWELFIIGSIFGWKRNDGTPKGKRRFRVAYIETGKGSGKSPLVAGIGLYFLSADKEDRAEVYAAATKKEQAQILFRDAVAMVRQSDYLAEQIQVNGAALKEHSLLYHPRNSFFKCIASDGSQSGPRPHCALLDEVHEHKDNTVVELIRAGVKSRTQPLTCLITNSGTDPRSVCGVYHKLATMVAEGMTENDSFFSFVCSVDQGEDPFKSEACWPKANPSLQEAGLPGYQYIRDQVSEARGMPAKEATVRRLNFCQWTEADNPWISAKVWLDAEQKIDPALLEGRRCYGGLDLSSTTDLTALALLFEPILSDSVWRLVVYYWTPGDTIVQREDRDKIDYRVWRDAGYLEAVPGKAINKRAVLKRMQKIVDRYNLVRLCYDDWRIEDLKVLLEEEGMHDVIGVLKNFRQGYKSMSPAVEEFERLLLNGELYHDGNPVTTWCAACTVVTEDPTGSRKPDKARSTGRVDGIVAATMAVGATIKTEPSKPKKPTADEILASVIKA